MADSSAADNRSRSSGVRCGTCVSIWSAFSGVCWPDGPTYVSVFTGERGWEEYRNPCRTGCVGASNTGRPKFIRYPELCCQEDGGYSFTPAILGRIEERARTCEI